MAEDFLADNNLCGQTLLRLVSRGHAIIAELLRLKDFIPPIFQSDQNKYHEIIIDFRYFKEQDAFDSKINGNDLLMELDEELRKNYIEILTRFYLAFESVHKYVCDLNAFLHEVEEGMYIQQTLETVFLNDEGKQLMCEALYLYGIMLLVTDTHIDGPVRERMLVSYYRYSVQRTHSNSKLDEVCQLLRSTGFLKSQPGRKPQHYPEEYFRRISIVPVYLDVVIGHLRSDDIYHQIATHPHPDHRSTALAQQAAMLVICLYFTPDILHNQTAKMREIVDKFFPDNWVTSVYMGLIFNLVEVWEPYKAARMALSNTIQAANVKECSIKHCNQMEQLIKHLHQLLKEGVLTEEFLLDNMQKLINLIRQSNVTLRWMLLHTNTLTAGNRNNSYNFEVISIFHSVYHVGAESLKKCRQVRDQVLLDTKYQPVPVFELLLDCAELELNVRETFRILLTEKRSKWLLCKKECIERLTELADVFSGAKPLSRVEKNESLQLWLREIAQQVEALNYEEGTASGRKMVQLISALEEVQEFHQLDSQLQVKQFLTETRRQLHQMIRTANIREDFLITLQIVSDLSYAWLIIDSYTSHMQTAIRKDPSLVGRLRATFLKLSSALDLPLMRINQARSADLVSVSQYYSTELVSYIRHVLHIIPQSMFALVEQIVQLQTNVIKEMPMRLDKDKLKDYAQLDQRFQVAKLTESVSTFTEGILAMKTTLVGIVRLDPKRLLEEGIRRELVRRMVKAMHDSLSFNAKARNSDLAHKLTSLGETMEGLRKSFEYIQDYVRIQGLRMFQEETARIVGYNVEQECNTFQTDHIQDWQSKFQSTAVPIPRLPSNDPHSATFIGRLAREILRITDPKTTTFVPSTNTWYDSKSQAEVLNFLLFSQLEQALSTSGLAGLDTLFAFMITTELTNLFSDLKKEVFRHQDSLEVLAEFDHLTAPTTTILGQPSKTYGTYCTRFHKSFQTLLDRVLKIGQLQLLRRSCSQQLKSTASFDSGLLWQALETLSLSVVNDVVRRDKSSSSISTSLLPELAEYLHWSGLYEPFEKIYVATHSLDLPYIPHLLLLFIVSNVHKFTYSKQLASLVSKRPQDGADGTPFVIGSATLFRHLGSASTQACCSLLIQFARSHLEFGAR
ncbi:WASH complex subunit 5 isoform X2 [Daphnia magna]|uniref:WASH complex subunit 5 isoform X2 n=1 Tax=Daphnia magna TaxID=35525 RepID=UPI001E1BC280|nr:WASH complex subunit 5 isoform X2 [Daphnia magna]